MVLVVSDPVHVLQAAVVAMQRVVVIAPEALEAFFLGRHATITLGEDVPPGLIATVVQAGPVGADDAFRSDQHGDHGTHVAGKTFHFFLLENGTGPMMRRGHFRLSPGFLSGPWDLG